MEKVWESVGRLLLELFQNQKKYTYVICVLYAVLAVALLLLAFVPAEFVARSDPKDGLQLAGYWPYASVALALSLLLLLALYLRAMRPSQASGGSATAGTECHVLYSPQPFAHDLYKYLKGSSPASWGQRALYVGTDGASSWLSMSELPEYQISFNKLVAGFRKLVPPTRSVASVISLGPGDGATDVALLTSLRRLESAPIQYVPIDISEGLLLSAMRHLDGNLPAGFHMPFGVLGDFEYGWKTFSNLLPPPMDGSRLFSLLGNTASNLDSGLEQFFSAAWGNLEPGDYLLFDVLLGSFDPRLGPHPPTEGDYDPNRLFPDSVLMQRYKWFIAQGARRITGDFATYDDAERKLARSIRVDRTKSDDMGFDQVRLLYGQDAAAKTIFCWRRYATTDALCRWLQTNLHDCHLVGTEKVTDDGETTELILLHKPLKSS
jgi:hypothetical protein